MIQNVLAKHPQWREVLEICRTLQKAGHQAVLAGGCVRDALRGQLAKDLDVATSASPEEVQKIFPKVVMVGQSFGVCRVVGNQEQDPIEVATFREEFDYRDGRRPETVIFSSMEKDAERRDFTVNALFFEPFTFVLYDFVGGQKDLKKKTLRTVGNPKDRFSEDALRLLRAARFAAQLQFAVEKQTLSAIRERAQDLVKVSRERWQEEINKSFGLQKPDDFFLQLESMGLLPVLFPGWNWQRTSQKNFFSTSVPKKWGWAALIFLQNSVEPSTALIEIKKMKLSNDVMDFCQLCLDLQGALQKQKLSFADGMALMKKKSIGQVSKFWAQMASARGEVERLQPWTQFLNQYAPEGELPPALLGGADLMALGLSPGPQLGYWLEESYALQIQERLQSKSEILKKIKEKMEGL